ncbi:MAG: replicative DNA helicase [Ruminococcus sp.]|nr:replicative DNA helicase [Ruminococcus sp.]
MESNNLPHSSETEQALLGSIIANPSLIPKATENLKPEYFFTEQHRMIYVEIVKMYSNNDTVDLITITDKSVSLGIVNSSSVTDGYLSKIEDLKISESQIKSYCDIIKDKYVRRFLVQVAENIIKNAYVENDLYLLLDSLENQIYAIRQERVKNELIPISEAVTEAYDYLGKITGPDKEKYKGLNSGFVYLDNIISGLNKSDLIIIAARPAMGKTSFAMNIAVNVARRTEKAVVVFNLEMSGEQLALRMLSTESLVDSGRIRNGRLTGEEWEKLANGAGYLSSLPMYIDDTASISVQQIKSKLKRLRNVGLVVIDYLQLISSASRRENRVTEVSEITRQLKIMAKELDIPVILLSQLSRGVESRNDKRPMLSDLRESGSIEQDADIVLFLYRDAYYNKDSPNTNISECIIAKNRHGETGTIELMWDGRYTRFSNPVYDDNPGRDKK